MANKKEYTNEDIVSLKGEDRVRKRPAVIFGSDGLEGCKHSVFEILSNSIDEARDGHGDKIIVTKYNDDSIEVEDFGRGCPVDYNQREKKYNWELVYCELYAGGKYNNNGGDNYEYSLGLNGLGACATQYSSEFMDVEVFRDGYKYDLHFEKGRNVGGLKKEETKQKKTGTKTHWRPDLEVFTDIKIENEYFEDVLKKQAVVNPNITFILRIQRENNSFEEKTFYYENGIADYVAEIAGEKPLTSVQFFTGDRKGRDREDKDDYKVKLSVAFTFSNQVKCLEYYHNSSFLEHGGSPEDAVKSAFTSQINAYLKSNNKYLKNEKPITFQDIEDCLVLVSSSFSTQTSYANQTKKAITNKFIKECMTEFLKHNLEIYFIENPDEAVKIAEQVLVNKRSREKAEKSRIDLKKKLAGSIDLSNQVQKFVDCRSKDLSQRELYIVEGDSAGGSAKEGRDRHFQAILPLRGKILNVEKTRLDKALGNNEIKSMLTAFGCGFGDEFDESKLRYHRIVCMTDADVDGAHIRILMLTFFYRYMRPLVEKGYVYAAMPPLYKVTKGKMEKYVYDDDELQRLLDEIGRDPKPDIQRYKGLGEMSAEQLWQTTMNPETRTMMQITPEDAMAADEIFTLLMGDQVEPRRKFIEENADLVKDLDV